MKRTALYLALIVGMSPIGLLGCDDGGSSGAAVEEGFAAEGEGCATTADCIGTLECDGSFLCATASVGDSDAGSTDPAPQATIHPDCGFDEELKGTGVGDHVKNFSLKTVDSEEYNVHAENCGQPGRKALYFILGTGWCGACESYASRAEQLYQTYKDQGLEILWVESENQDYEAVTLEWLEAWREEKGTTFPLTRDLKFLATYGAMAHASNSLPHLYVVDPTNMELVFAGGGGSMWEETEAVVADLLELPAPLP